MDSTERDTRHDSEAKNRCPPADLPFSLCSPAGCARRPRTHRTATRSASESATEAAHVPRAVETKAMLARQLFTLLLAAHGAPAHAGHPANSVDMTKKSCEASGGTPSCAVWCDSNFLQQHCPDCQCSACDFCQDAKETCEPLPNSDGSDNLWYVPSVQSPGAGSSATTPAYIWYVYCRGVSMFGSIWAPACALGGTAESAPTLN